MAMLEAIARMRVERSEGRAIVAVRWLLHPGSGLDVTAYALTRELGGAIEPIIVDRSLPGAIKGPAPGRWSIDPDRLATDREARRTMAGGIEVGIPLPDVAEIEAIAPILTFALPIPDEDALAAMLDGIATVTADAHRADPELIAEHWRNWPDKELPPIGIIRAMRANGSQADQELYRDVIAFYRRHAAAYLFVLAEDFGFAKLLGLGTDDLLGENIDPAVMPRYRLSTDVVNAPPITITCTPVDPASPAPPTDLGEAQHEDFEVWPEEGLVGYQPFAPFFGGPTPWQPERPPGAAALSKDACRLVADLVATAARGPRLTPTQVARLRWSAPPGGDWPRERNAEPHDGSNERPTRPLLNAAARFWLVDVYAFGAGSAVDETPPKLPPTPVFVPCVEGVRLRAAAINVYVHGTSLPWGAAPLEGWHSYRVRGVDILGIEGPCSNAQPIRLRETFAPPAPLVVPSIPSVTLHAGNNSIEVLLGWNSLREYRAPDAKQYRLQQCWTELAHLPVTVVAVSSAAEGLEHVQVVARLADAGGTMQDAVLQLTAGGRLLTTNGEYAVRRLEGAGSSSVRLERSAGRAPPLGAAALRFPRPGMPSNPLAFERLPVQPARVQLVSIDPLVIQLRSPEGMMSVIPGDARVHLHLLGCDFAATAEEGRTRLEDPPEHSRAAAALAALRQLPEVEVADLFDKSPALVLPQQRIVVPLDPPQTFAAGTLLLGVATADATAYTASSRGLGNEGEEAEALVTATRPTAPAKIVVPYPPRLWALGAAEFLDTAEARISWPLVDGCLRYEVECALEPRLVGLAVAASPGALATNAAHELTDDALLEIAATAGAQAAFERISDHVFGPEYIDALPGRVPTRAIYQVRAVSPAGTPGSWALVALVRVPDVRIAAPPNLLLVEPPAGKERALRLSWTQAGPLDGLGFQIEMRVAAQSNVLHAEEGWSVVADYLPKMLAPGPSRVFEAVVENMRPGLLYQLRVRAVRHAPDPRDPRARLIRRIEGRASIPSQGRSYGTLVPPNQLRQGWVADARPWISWTGSGDVYDTIELRRRAPGHSGFKRILLPGSAQRYEETAPLEPGQWLYELAVTGAGCRAMSDRIVVTIGAEHV